LSMDVRVTARHKDNWDEKVDRAVRQWLDSTAVVLRVYVKDNIRRMHILDTERLLDSVTTVKDGRYSRRVVVDVPYAAYVEYGTRPHWPPVEPIRAWVSRHKSSFGIRDEKDLDRVTYLIRRKIGKLGTRARPFMRQAVAALRHELPKRLRRLGETVDVELSK